MRGIQERDARVDGGREVTERDRCASLQRELDARLKRERDARGDTEREREKLQGDELRYASEHEKLKARLVTRGARLQRDWRETRRRGEGGRRTVSERRRKRVSTTGIPMMDSDSSLKEDRERKQDLTDIPTKTGVEATMGGPTYQMTRAGTGHTGSGI